jgi:cytochrome c2
MHRSTACDFSGLQQASAAPMAQGLRETQIGELTVARRKGSAALRGIVWGLVTAAAVFVFAVAMITQGRRAQERSSLFLEGSPQQGSRVFRDRGCIRCHSVNGEGGKVGPDLGHRRPGESSLPQLVTAMWNHAPKMWERMRADRVPAPDLSYDDVVQLLAYLSMSRHMDGPGDPSSGRELFRSKGCVQCHAAHGTGGVKGPDLKDAVARTGPMEWSKDLWNHASLMQRATERAGMAWPQFHGRELLDLYAFTRQTASGTNPVLLGDAERGWQLFQQKSCIGCHSLRAAYQLQGPSLGPEQPLPDTFTELAGAMVSHAPQMENAMTQQGIVRPNLSTQEMTDIFAFLYSLRYNEPSGSPHVGASVFKWRGCSRCHGHTAEGTARAPGLRGRTYNSINLAVALWRHGQRMQLETAQLGIGWPTLTEDDVGDLLAFLNSARGQHP